MFCPMCLLVVEVVLTFSCTLDILLRYYIDFFTFYQKVGNTLVDVYLNVDLFASGKHEYDSMSQVNLSEIFFNL
jgi:ABC-type uncharacterized transport system permease subunit